jgi:hypothetical protein
MNVRKMLWLVVVGLVLVGCGGKDDGQSPGDARGTETTVPCPDAADDCRGDGVVYRPAECSKDWSGCLNVGETWPQSYPPMTKEMAYDLALRWNMCASMFTGTLPWLWECAMGTCLSYEAPYLDAPSMECLLAAKDCEGVRCCWGATNTFGCDGDFTLDAKCVDDVLHSYVAPFGQGEAGPLIAPMAWDCAWSHGNPHCITVESRYPDEPPHIGCGVGTCEEGTAASCSGNVLVRCFYGILRHVDCAERGRICAPQATDNEGDEAACVLATTCLLPHCEGNTAVFCAGGNEVMRIDCSWYGDGFSCQEGGIEDEQWLGGCRNPAAECDSDADDDYCEGTVAHYCTDKDQWLTFDCADFANGTCVMVENNTSPELPGKKPNMIPQCVEGL